MTGKNISIPPVVDPIIRQQLNAMNKDFFQPPAPDTERLCYYCNQVGDIWQMKREYRSNAGKRYIHFACHFKKIMKKY